MDFSSNSKWLLVLELVVLHRLPTIWCILEVVWRFEQRTSYIGSLMVNLILVCQEVLKWVWPSMNLMNYVGLHSHSITTSKHAPQVDRIYWYRMQNHWWQIIWDQIQRKSPVWYESKENSISVIKFGFCGDSLLFKHPFFMPLYIKSLLPGCS